jgi:hypothetical protein
LKTYNLKKMSLPKIAVLATGLTAAVLVATMGPSTAQAYPDQTADCNTCHTGVSGPVTAVPTSTTPAANAAYTVLVTPPVNAAGGGTEYRITDKAGAIVVSGGGPGFTAATYTAAMTAPSAAGSYVYTVWAVHGPSGTGMAASTTYTITVATSGTTPPATIAPVGTPAPVTAAVGTPAATPAQVASPTATTTPSAPVAPTPTTAPVVVATGNADVLPVGAPNTGAGGTPGSSNGPLVDLGALSLLLAGAAATQVVRHRRQA